MTYFYFIFFALSYGLSVFLAYKTKKLSERIQKLENTKKAVEVQEQENKE